MQEYMEVVNNCRDTSAVRLKQILTSLQKGKAATFNAERVNFGNFMPCLLWMSTNVRQEWNERTVTNGISTL